MIPGKDSSLGNYMRSTSNSKLSTKQTTFHTRYYTNGPAEHTLAKPFDASKPEAYTVKGFKYAKIHGHGF